ncbi:response regulator transcription factor [Mollicutes bacterium LVI A0078]|nr:response regulator transcription factor [Mollicutes bacterium LVI A0075]WOO91749.1 response regulator transcription factor [Mollicutes bacterium LVI A0078]
MQKKILIVEDDQLLRLGLKVFLENEGYEVVETTSGNKAIEVVEEHSFHLIITDIMMDDGDGISLLKYLVNQNIKIPVVVLSALGSENDQLIGYNLNVLDYLVKPINYDILSFKLNKYFEMSNANDDGEIYLDSDTYSLKIYGDSIKLTQKEFELLSLLMQFPTKIFSKYDLINEVWYGNMNMSEKIVEVTILNIRKKLGDHATLLKTHRGLGYSYEGK